MKRIAILLDESGVEIWRGSPADMPVRFVPDNNPDAEPVEWNMNSAVSAGTPIDDVNGFDLVIHNNDC